jgi:DNA polymerase-3 subunit delta'
MVATTLAKTVNCQQNNLDSCDQCISCLKIDRNQHPDFHLIDAQASDAIKIEYIRQLKNDINLKAYEAKIKVFIIDNAHNLTAQAANAILKILEEPPGNSLIILISSVPRLLFKTIISRCQIFKFSSLRIKELKEILKKDYHLDNRLAHFLAYFSEGRIGKSLRLKDTDILREKNRLIDGFISPGSADLGNLQLQERDQVRGCLNILAGWFRDLYLIKTGLAHSEVINIDRIDLLMKLINKYSFVELDQVINSISDSLLYLEQNVNIKLLLSNLKAGLWKN